MADRPPVSGISFRAQAWSGHDLVAEVTGLSYDAAKHVAQSYNLTGQTGRLMSDEKIDWCEVYPVHGSMRCGRFAETVLIHNL